MVTAGIADWDTTNGCPASVIVQVRGLVVVLAAAISVTVAGPVWVEGETVNQPQGLERVQEQPAGIVSVRLVLPPLAGADQLPVLRLATQAGGAEVRTAVRSALAELPSASKARTVMRLVPRQRGMLLALQLEVPVAIPVTWLQAFDH